VERLFASTKKDGDEDGSIHSADRRLQSTQV